MNTEEQFIDNKFSDNLRRVTLTMAKSLKGEVEIPPDKSIAHRAIFLNAYAEGEAEITN